MVYKTEESDFFCGDSSAGASWRRSNVQTLLLTQRGCASGTELRYQDKGGFSTQKITPEIQKSGKVRAYTLVELLVVMGILLIAFSAIFVGSGSGDGARLSSAQRTLSGLVKAARSQAILKNAPVRLIIQNDNNINELDKYRRFVGIVYQKTDSAGNKGWIAADKGTYLPKGIYFDSATSNTMSGEQWTVASAMRINYPRASLQTDGIGTDFLFYEFNSNGTSNNPNAYLIFRAGKVVPGNDDTATLDLPSSDQQQKSRIRSGLLFRPAGTATLINDPDEIDI